MIARRLEGAGLLHRPGHLARAHAVTGWLLATMLIIGFSRLWFGLASDHSVAFLAMLLAGGEPAARMFAARAAPTQRGGRALATLTKRNKKPRACNKTREELRRHRPRVRW